MQNQVNISPIAQFIQQVKSAELTQSKDVKMTILQARLLSLTLTELLDKVNQDYEQLLLELKNNPSSDVVSISMDGGGFDE